MSTASASKSSRPGSFVETSHYQERATARPIAPEVADFISTYGVDIRRRGMTHLVVLRRRLPTDLRDTPLARRSQGWVLLEDEGELVTCIQRRDAHRWVQRKGKRRRAGDMRPRRASARRDVRLLGDDAWR